MVCTDKDRKNSKKKERLCAGMVTKIMWKSYLRFILKCLEMGRERRKSFLEEKKVMSKRTSNSKNDEKKFRNEF